MTLLVSKAPFRLACFVGFLASIAAAQETPLYYDYVENGVLKGGRVMVDRANPAHRAELGLDPIGGQAAMVWPVTTIINSGDPANRVDIVILGDGYTAGELGDYATHTDNVVNNFFAQEPFASYLPYFNVHRVDVTSNESGVDEIDLNIFKDTALDMEYGCFNIDRLLCINVSKAIAAAASAPDVDQILALANSTRYGGAGYPADDLGTVAGNNFFAVEVALHEFGHSFADLADEYDYADGATYTGPEPGETNVSIFNATAQVAQQRKWYRWMDLANVDTFQGAMYNQFGIYRPTTDSKMRALDRPFEEINIEQFVFSMYRSVSPIDDATPPSSTPLPASTTFFATPLAPLDHALSIQWSIDGGTIAGATSNTFRPSDYTLSTGSHVIGVTVTDNTTWVRDESLRASLMREVRFWPIVVAGPPCEVQKVLASDGAANDSFGGTVSISGNVAIVGAEFDDDNGTDSGSAYVFRNNSSSWLQEQKLTASDGAASDIFGYSVSVAGDVAVIGACQDDDNGLNSGSAYVFRYSGSTWVQEQKLTSSDGVAGDRFGFSVFISGSVALIGASGDDDNGADSGSAYIFRHNGSTWVQEQKLTASNGAESDNFGNSVSLFGDVGVIGAYLDDDNGADSGSAYLFRYNGSTWVQEQKFTASDGTASDELGYSVSVHGNFAVIGAVGDADNGANSGSAYLFRYNGSTWVQDQKLTTSDGAVGDLFGDSVSLFGDVVLIGAFFDDDNGLNSGSAYVFRYNGSVWVQEQKVTASDGAAGERFGFSVSISGDAVAVGALFDDDNGVDSGSAYVYSIAPDCNVNGIADFCDIRDGTSSDSNADGIPDNCQCVVPTPILANTEAHYCFETGVACVGADPNSCTSNGPCLPTFCATNADCNPFGSLDGRCINERCHTPYNRYITFYPPPVPVQATGVGLRVTFLAMPGPSNCPQMPDYSAFQDDVMWVGAPNPATGVSRLVSAPVYRVWGTELVVVSDCNIVPCSQYLIDVISSFAGCSQFCSACFSPGAILTTASRWGDVMGQDRLSPPSNSIPGFHDVGALVDRFQNLPLVPPNERPRCDLCRNVPTQGGGTVNVDFIDIGCVVDAFKGLSYDSSVKNAQGQHGPAGSGGTCAVP